MIPVELLRALALFAEPPDEQHAPIAAELGLGDSMGPAEYSELFLFQLVPYASVYLGEEGWIGGEARDRVAGFWGAVGRTPPAEPDHLTALLGLYAALSEEARDAEPATATLTGEGRRALLHEHLAPWVFAFLRRAATHSAYARWASLLAETLGAEAERVGPSATASVHLTAAPPLPDPREAGGRDFLAALLAPARSGTIVTRNDLAWMARELDLGLRAGERRYALEALLGQEPVGTLRALAAHFSRGAEEHGRDVRLLGASAEIQRDRARASADLLTRLVEAGADALVRAEAVR